VFRRRRIGDADPAAGNRDDREYEAAGEAGEDEDFYESEDEVGDEADEDEDLYEADEEFDEEDGVDEEDLDGQDEVQATRAGRAAGAGRGARRSERHDLSDPDTWTRLRDASVATPAHVRSAGPWDGADDFPEAERLDLGCVQVPVGEGANVQLAFSEETGVTLAVVAGDSALQLQAFAAPRSSGLWEKVRPEIAAEVARAGGRSQEQDGPFGPELLAWVTPQVEGQGQLPPQPLRFLGADGPRWFLRGLISGPAAIDSNLASPLEQIFAGVVVVRGDHAAPPETPLEFVLPEEARQAFESQAEAEAEASGMPNPFERGPEITETR
jgi:uncharacterized protein DUF3710